MLTVASEIRSRRHLRYFSICSTSISETGVSGPKKFRDTGYGLSGCPLISRKKLARLY